MNYYVIFKTKLKYYINLIHWKYHTINNYENLQGRSLQFMLMQDEK